MTDNRFPQYFEDDYDHALIHLAWIVKPDGKRILIFGYAEFIPSEYPPSDETPEQNIKVTLGENCRIFFTRIRMEVKTALISYLKLFDEKFIRLPVGGNNKTKKDVDLLVSSPTAEPAWPNLVLGTGRPYVSMYDANVRSHHAYSGKKVQILNLLKENEKAVEWLSRRFFFSFTEHEELLGSFHLAAHNPILRSLRARLMPSKENVPESIVYFPRLRAKKKSDTLTLFHYEKRLTGLYAPIAIQIQSDKIIQELSGRAEKVGHVVICSKRGLLEWSEPVGFLRQIGLSLGVQNKHVAVEVPNNRKSASTETYVVPRIGNELPRMIGTDTTPPAWKKIRKSERQRRLTKQAEKQGQRWFHESEEEAQATIRNLIGRARERVWIVDPYFTSVELFRFALATTSISAEILVVTSALALKSKDRLDTKTEAGEALLKQLPQFEKEYKISVTVLTGDTPPIHDRFLAIDNDIWFMGNSLHTLGKRAGMIIKLPYPEPVIENLKDIFKSSRAKSLKTWVNARKQSQDDGDHASSKST